MKVCTVEGCGGAVAGLGLCAKHYQRQRRASGRGRRALVPPCTSHRSHAWTSQDRCRVCGMARPPRSWT